MGYTTDFNGQFLLNKPLSHDLKDYLDAFNESRRVSRRLSEAFGIEGEFYVGDDRDDDIIDYNRPPKTQPGLWCQWRPNDDGTAIEWDGGEKFYNYVEWLEYIIKNFLAPKDYVLNGAVNWQGESLDDMGIINVKDNVISIKQLTV